MVSHQGHVGTSMMPKDFWMMVTNMVNTGLDDIDAGDGDYEDKVELHSIELDLCKWWLPDPKNNNVGFNHMVEDYKENNNLLLHGMVQGLPKDTEETLGNTQSQECCKRSHHLFW